MSSEEGKVLEATGPEANAAIAGSGWGPLSSASRQGRLAVARERSRSPTKPRARPRRAVGGPRTRPAATNARARARSKQGDPPEGSCGPRRPRPAATRSRCGPARGGPATGRFPGTTARGRLPPPRADADRPDRRESSQPLRESAPGEMQPGLDGPEGKPEQARDRGTVVPFESGEDHDEAQLLRQGLEGGVDPLFGLGAQNQVKGRGLRPEGPRPPPLAARGAADLDAGRGRHGTPPGRSRARAARGRAARRGAGRLGPGFPGPRLPPRHVAAAPQRQPGKQGGRTGARPPRRRGRVRRPWSPPIPAKARMASDMVVRFRAPGRLDAAPRARVHCLSAETAADRGPPGRLRTPGPPRG